MKRIWILLLLFVNISLFSQEEVARFTWEYRDYGNMNTYRKGPPEHTWKEFEVEFSFSSIDNFNIWEYIENFCSNEYWDIKPTDKGYIIKAAYASDIPNERDWKWRRVFGDHLALLVMGDQERLVNTDSEYYNFNPQIIVITYLNAFKEDYPNDNFIIKPNFDYDEQEGYWTGNIVHRAKPYKFFIEEYIIYKTNK
jgi:hypothetical protein